MEEGSAGRQQADESDESNFDSLLASAPEPDTGIKSDASQVGVLTRTAVLTSRLEFTTHGHVTLPSLCLKPERDEAVSRRIFNTIL